ncbi:MAG: FAD-dependent oxidoreductase [Thermonemataceae bacterium]
MASQKVVIVGAGLAGSLMSIFLAQRGFEVEVYEKRPDMRRQTVAGGRSINLALSHRGIRALNQLGIAPDILQKAIPMYGRMLHNLSGEQLHLPYGKDTSEYINSISRGDLNIDLMNLTEPHPHVSYFFNETCMGVDLDAATLSFYNTQHQTTKEVKAAAIIAADGAGSVIRQAMMQYEGYEAQSDFLAHGYKELTIPSGKDNTFLIEKHALHIWPRGSHMLIALPNLDGTFTVTLFLANEGENSFASLDTPERVQHFFKQQFPDTLSLMPQLTQEFFENPTGLLGTVKCYPWTYKNTLLLGDAAHAIVPFYGQGMNASFEDCFLLDQCIEAHGADWPTVFAAYQQRRKADTDAIADLAVENFYEMRDKVADPEFQQMRELEHLLENKYEDYHSKYSMVTFHPEIGYAEAKQRGNKQNKVLYDLCLQVDHLDALNLQEVYEMVKSL